jgi:hypothetical protein
LNIKNGPFKVTVSNYQSGDGETYKACNHKDKKPEVISVKVPLSSILSIYLPYFVSFVPGLVAIVLIS